MARYILIDNCSGYIWGDTADIGGKLLPLGTEDADIIEACMAVDRQAGETDRSYQVLGSRNPRLLQSNESGYLVYRADVRGSEQVPVIEDGQDPEMIEAVERDCELVAVVRTAENERQDRRAEEE